MTTGEKADPFRDMNALLDEQGYYPFHQLLQRQNEEGYRMLCGLAPGSRYEAAREEIYQTLHALEAFGGIVPYHQRCAVGQDPDPTPWNRIGRPSKIELLMLILFAMAKRSPRGDAAVLLSGGDQSHILGFDYNSREMGTEYITGSSLLLNFPISMTRGGVLLTLRAPQRFLLLQGENRQIGKILYYHGSLGPVEREVLRIMGDRPRVEKVPNGFWDYRSLVARMAPEARVPEGFWSPEDLSQTVEDGDPGAGPWSNPFQGRVCIHPEVPEIEFAGLVAILSRLRANCLKRKVGAVLLDLYDDEEEERSGDGGNNAPGKIRSVGYNGFKSGLMDWSCDRSFCNKRRYGAKDDRLCYSPCAEIDCYQGYYHDASIREVFYRQVTRKHRPRSIRTVSVTTIEPCERCTSILFENGILDFYPMGQYQKERTKILNSLSERGHIRIHSLGGPFWEAWEAASPGRGPLDPGPVSPSNGPA
ncbi:MAG: hypothetical protein KA419_10830 [Acidobacteria bacterium]|nr:hypothetical protein [Acidobacteriota bacterium]